MSALNNKKIKPHVVFLAFVCCLLFLFLPAKSQALTEVQKKRCNDFYEQFNVKIDTKNADLKKLSGNIVAGLPQYCTADSLIYTAVKILMAAAGAVAALFIIVGGYWYLTAAGNEEWSEKGKKTLVNSIIGLVVIIMSFVIVRIVASTLSGKLSGGGGSPPSSTGTPPPSGEPEPRPEGSPKDKPEDKPEENPNAGDLQNFEADWMVINIPASTKVGQDFTVSAQFKASDEERFQDFCSGSPSTAAALKVEFEGQPRGRDSDGKFADAGAYKKAEVTLVSLSPREPGGRYGAVILSVCGVKIGARNVFFEVSSARPRN